MDRDSKFSAAFRQILTDTGTEPVRLPPRSPNLNAHIERFWRSLREECTDRMIFFGEAMLRRAIREFIRTGIAGVHLEDQCFPKRAHYHKYQVHSVPTPEFVTKIKFARARK